MDLSGKFFSTGRFMKGIYRTFIALITKFEPGYSFDKFRAISLSDFFYHLEVDC